MASMVSEDVLRDLASRIGSELPRFAMECSEKSKSERPEWTWGVWKFWDSYRRSETMKRGRIWELCPEEPRKGEYLVDFMLFEKGYGPRIACESEWEESPDEVLWDFEKLTGVKSDIKVLIHDCQSGDLLKKLSGAIPGNANALVSPREGFLIVGFEGDRVRESRWWIPDREGPFEIEEIEFRLLTS